MRHMKTVQVPASETQEVEKVTCDLCHAEIRPVRFSAEAVEVLHRTGSSYPEGGQGDEIAFDLCGKCFDERLVPWLESQGAVARTTEWDW